MERLSTLNEYEPMNLGKLPSYLPSLPPPQVEQHQVYEKLLSLNNTKSTLPRDIPAKLRKEVAVEITAPLTYTINSCLSEGIYPEFRITPVNHCGLSTVYTRSVEEGMDVSYSESERA